MEEEKRAPEAPEAEEKKLSPRERLAAWLLSDRGGMGVVNLLFLAALFVGNYAFIVAAMALWMAFLALSFRRNPSRVVRGIYLLLFLFAAAAALVNLRALLLP